MSTTTEAAAADDRLSQLKAFDDTKAGVKGLVDAGITAVPAIFRHPVQEQGRQVSSSGSSGAISVPVIDLSAADAAADPAAARAEVVAQVRAAAETVGFFQLVNHGVPFDLLSETLASVRRFHESPAAAKRPYYTRDPRRRLRFNSNFDLFQSPAANWRDTLFFSFSAAAAAAAAAPDGDLPAAVRRALPEYAAAVRHVAARVLALLSEALGLAAGRLAGMGCGGEGVSVVCNYYPPCPEPELTLGCAAHSDPSFITVLLLQDGAAGLQARLGGGGGGGDEWADVAPPVAGALLVNVGDLLQLVSNGRFRSVEHRVVATARGAGEARVSVACFCNADAGAGDDARVYGPIPELLATGGEGGGGGAARAVYRSVTVAEFLAHYDGKGLDGRPALDHFRLH